LLEQVRVAQQPVIQTQKYFSATQPQPNDRQSAIAAQILEDITTNACASSLCCRTLSDKAGRLVADVLEKTTRRNQETADCPALANRPQ